MLDHPASDKAPFGQAVRARSALGGGWLGWVVAVDDIAPVEDAAGPRVGERQPAPPRRHRAALEAARRQGPAGRPAAAVLHRVGVPRRAAPQRRRDRRRVAGRAWRSPATRPGQRVARQTVDAPLEDVKVEWVAPHGTPGIVAAQFQTPNGARPASEPLVGLAPLPGAVPSPNIWHHPETYEVENRAVDPDGLHRVRDARGPGDRLGRPRRPRPRLRHRLPPAPLGGRRRASVYGVEPHADLAAVGRAGVRRGSANVTVLPGTAQRVPLPDATVDVMQARWAYFFGPGCEPGLRELDRVMRRGGTAFVDRQRLLAQHVRRRGSGAATRRRRRRGGAVLVRARLAAPRRSTCVWRSRPRGPRGRACASSSTRGSPTRCSPATGHRGGLRGQPLVEALLVTVGDGLSWLAGRASGRASSTQPGSGIGRCASSSAEVAHHLDRDLLQRLPHRGQRRACTPGRRSSRRSRPPRRRGPARRPSPSSVRSAPIATVSLAQTNAVGRSAAATSSSACAARAPNSRVSSPRADSRLVDRPWSCIRSTQPPRRSSPMNEPFCQPTQAIREWPRSTRWSTASSTPARPSTSTQGCRGVGLVPGPAERHERHAAARSARRRAGCRGRCR